MKTIGKLFLAVVMLAFVCTGAMAGTLEKVQKDGQLILGVSEGVAGFSAPDSNGRWTGFDVDMGRAVAAAVLKDPEAIKFVPLASKQKVVAVSSGQVDLSRGTTWTMKRDSKQGVDFTAVLFYDGQGLMVKKSLGVEKALDLDGGSVAVVSGTTSELNVADFHLLVAHHKQEEDRLRARQLGAVAGPQGRGVGHCIAEHVVFALRAQFGLPALLVFETPTLGRFAQLGAQAAQGGQVV